MGLRKSVRHRALLPEVVVAVLAAACALAPGAGAELIHVRPGQVAGVTPFAGVNPASLPGSFVTRSQLAASEFSSNGNLDYGGGPVLHNSSPYLIFWDPSNQITATEKSLLERYFNDVAHDSGRSSNVYGVDRQFSDTGGIADYSQTWSASQAITDTQPYPPTADQCTENAGFTETACLFDAQLQAEVSRVVAADGLPEGVRGIAPIYFVVTPPTVNSCFADNSTCTDNVFCAYHSAFVDHSNVVLYSDIPTIGAATSPKACQIDNNPQVQSPNGNQIADVTIKYLSHEDNETITDPIVGSGWIDTATGEEDGDNCNISGAFNPAGGTNPNAFLPALGGTAAGQNLYDQLINGNQYYIQSEWSNGDVNCEMRPTSDSTLSAAFAPPARPTALNSATFDPSPSSSGAGFSSTAWNFGDGTDVFAQSGPVTIRHTYAAAGRYTVKLTLVDTFGHMSTISHAVTVFGNPSAVIRFGTSSAIAGVPVALDASSSTDVGSSITADSWNFGDGALGSGQSLTHAFTRTGELPVSLTVIDASGATSTTTSQLAVRSATITHLSLKKGKKIERLRATVNGPGKLKLGSKTIGAPRPGTFVVAVKLTPRQRTRLDAHQPVTLHLKLRFVPRFGTPSSKKVKIKIFG